MEQLDFSTMPSYCAHEHWGSISAIGMSPEGFRGDVERGALPHRRVGLLDILLDPYFGGNLANGGVYPQIASLIKTQNHLPLEATELARAWRCIQPLLASNYLTGTYQSIRYGLIQLYGVDIVEADDAAIVELDTAIGDRYTDMFGWYHDAMTRVAFSDLIRPVHPEFYMRVDNREAADSEGAMTRTVMRIDPLLELWPTVSPRRANLAAAIGVDPGDAASWRQFIQSLFDLAANQGAVGIKQLQAYSRTLEFLPRQDSDVCFKGELNPNEVRVFQDWVVHECCIQASERGWPQQVHVGTHNIGQSSPMPLLELARRYPKMAIVQLHCWPFLNEAGWLTKQMPNVYIDTCWLPILNPAYFRQALQGWCNYVPTDKLMCSHDATSVEMAAGSAHFVRTILTEVLRAQQQSLHVGARTMYDVAGQLLHDNAARIYAH
ncbi:MAG: amidohydrolase family protein [Anaerolineae bacterium]